MDPLRDKATFAIRFDERNEATGAKHGWNERRSLVWIAVFFSENNSKTVKMLL